MNAGGNQGPYFVDADLKDVHQGERQRVDRKGDVVGGDERQVSVVESLVKCTNVLVPEQGRVVDLAGIGQQRCRPGRGAIARTVMQVKPRTLYASKSKERPTTL